MRGAGSTAAASARSGFTSTASLNTIKDRRINDGSTSGTRAAQIGSSGKPHQGRNETRQAGGQEAQARPCAQGGDAEGCAEDATSLTATGGRAGEHGRRGQDRPTDRRRWEDAASLVILTCGAYPPQFQSMLISKTLNRRARPARVVPYPQKLARRAGVLFGIALLLVAV